MFKNKEQQFDFYWKEIFTGLAYNPIEFNTYRFDQTMSLPGKVNKLYDMFKVLAMNNQEVMDYLKAFVETFDSKLYESVKDVLQVWLENGQLADIVREAINEEVIEARTDYLDHTYLNLKERLDNEREEVILARGESQTLGERLDVGEAEITEISTQLTQTDIDLQQRGINIFQFKEHIPNIQENRSDWDWTQALRQAINYCRLNLIRKIFVPDGDYRITDDIDISLVPLLEIVGVTNGQMYAGKGAMTRFLFENCVIGFNTKKTPYITLKNLELNGTGTTNIVLNFGFITRLENVSITGGVVAGGKITLGQNSTFINTSFSGNVGDGLILEDVLTTTLTFIACFFRENGGKGISGDTSDAYFLRCTFESNVGKAIHLTEAKKLLKFESCYWEANEMPNGVHVQLENAEAQFENCDFGSTQIVRVANLINSQVEFRNSKHAGGLDTPSLNFDVDSKVILYNSFEHYPIDNRVIRPRVVNEKTGRESWSVVDSPSVIDVVIEGSVPLVDYEVYVTVSCAQELTYTISDRWQEGFKINIHKKPTGANAVFIWKVVY